MKFIQYQTVIRNALKSSPTHEIKQLWKESSQHTNAQYDQYQNTKQVLTAIRKHHEDRIIHDLKSQGFTISSILKYSFLKATSFWTIVQQNMPKNIFNFTIKCLNNTLATKKNLYKWSLLNLLGALSAFNLKLYSILYLAENHISIMGDTRRDITLCCNFLLNHFPLYLTIPYMRTFLLFFLLV